MNYSVNLSSIGVMYAVPSKIIDKYIKTVTLEQLKVILVIFHNIGNKYTAKSLSETLGYPETVISDALNFWMYEEILICDKSDVKVQAFSKTECKKAEKVTENKPARLSSVEIAKRIETDENVRILLTEADDIFGSMLSPSNKAVLVGIYDYCGIEVDAIIMLLAYVKGMNVTNMRYVEKLAYTMAESGITDHSGVVAYLENLKDRNTHESEIIREFGINSAILSPKQKEFVRIWYEDWGFSVDMIRLAFQKCLDNTSKLSFPYINKILQSWYELQITTLKQAIDDDDRLHKRNMSAKSNKKTAGRSYNISDFSITNYSVPEYKQKNKLEEK